MISFDVARPNKIHHSMVKSDSWRPYINAGGLDTDEILHRFGGRIIGVVKGKSIAPVVLRDVYFRDSPGSCLRLYTVVATPYQARKNDTFNMEDYDFVLGHPPLGVINYRDSVLFTQRGPERDWKRGLNRDTLGVVDPLSADTALLRVHGAILGPYISNKTLMMSLYNRSYYSPSDAIAKVDSGERRAAAINNRIFVAVMALSENIVIGYNKNFVGELIGGTVVIGHHVSHLVEELSMYFPCEVRRK